MGEIRVVWSNATKSASLPNIAHPTSTGLLWQSGTLILLLLLLFIIDLVKVIFWVQRKDCEISECPHPCFQRVHHCPNCHTPQDAVAKSSAG